MSLYDLETGRFKYVGEVFEPEGPEIGGCGDGFGEVVLVLERSQHGGGGDGGVESR